MKEAVINFAVAVLAEVCERAKQEDAPIYLGDKEVDNYVRLSEVCEVINEKMNDCEEGDSGKNMGNYIKINPYREGPFQTSLEKWFNAVEEALGFKLFFWQKTYIECGVFRCFGETTAKILRDLAKVNEPPMDLIGYRRGGAKKKLFYDELLRMKETLDAAGVPTREVWFCENDRRKWIQKQKEVKVKGNGCI